MNVSMGFKLLAGAGLGWLGHKGITQVIYPLLTQTAPQVYNIIYLYTYIYVCVCQSPGYVLFFILSNRSPCINLVQTTLWLQQVYDNVLNSSRKSRDIYDFTRKKMLMCTINESDFWLLIVPSSAIKNGINIAKFDFLVWYFVTTTNQMISSPRHRFLVAEGGVN